jgi:sugar phosphate isomerase/epimerase
VDLFLEPDRASAEQVDPVQIGAALDRLGLGVVGHLAWYLPIGSPMPQLRRVAVEAAIDYLQVFSRAGVSAVTVHANWPSSLFSVEQGVAWQVESLRRIIEAAAPLSLKIMYEPLTSEWDGVRYVQQVFDAVPDLLCHLDIGHCNLAGRTPGDVIRALADRLYHLHVHDNDGLRDLHLPPGTGAIDWQATFQAIKSIGYDRTLTLEVFSEDRDYVLLAKRKIEALCE